MLPPGHHLISLCAWCCDRERSTPATRRVRVAGRWEPVCANCSNDLRDDTTMLAVVVWTGPKGRTIYDTVQRGPDGVWRHVSTGEPMDEGWRFVTAEVS